MSQGFWVAAEFDFYGSRQMSDSSYFGLSPVGIERMRNVARATGKRERQRILWSQSAYV